MSVVTLQDIQPRQQPSQRQNQRLITGRGRHFGMRVPQKPAPSTEELVAHRKRQMCQEEIQTSTTNLVKTSLSHIARSEEHAKRFKKEIDSAKRSLPFCKNTWDGCQSCLQQRNSSPWWVRNGCAQGFRSDF